MEKLFLDTRVLWLPLTFTQQMSCEIQLRKQNYQASHFSRPLNVEQNVSMDVL